MIKNFEKLEMSDRRQLQQIYLYFCNDCGIPADKSQIMAKNYFKPGMIAADEIERIQNTPAILEALKAGAGVGEYVGQHITGATSINGYSKYGVKQGLPRVYGDETTIEHKLALRREKHGDKFPDAVIERVQGEIIDIYDTETYISLYLDTMEAIKEEYIANNPDRVKLPLNRWVNDLYCQIKKATPPVDRTNISIIDALWEAYKDFAYSLGAMPTIEGYSIMTGVSYSYLEQAYTSNRGDDGVNRGQIELLQKMRKETERALVNHLQQSDKTDVNKFFILKTMHGYVEAAPVQKVEYEHTIKTIADMPKFGAIEGN